MEKKLKIGLFGMHGLYNYGCEAIVRGTYNLIKQSWPESDIVLYTHTAEADGQILKDLDITVEQVLMNNNILIRRLINKALRIFSISKQLLIWDSNSIINECDLVFSVGGDIYTIPKYILDNNNETKHSLIVEFGNAVLQKKPYVIWGASIGPFGNKDSVKKYYFNHLKNSNQIFCREEETFSYLQNNGLETNVNLTADPAFYIKSKNNSNNYSKSDKIRIALNLSPLSIRELSGENNQSFKEKIIRVIKDLLTIDNTEIILVPHVIIPSSKNDDDFGYLKDIYNSIPDKHTNSVSLLEDAKGFLGTKDFLKTCDILIAARMHCAVNAVVEGIPTIFLTYSQKGLGMANYIYNNSNWVVPLIDIERDLKNKTEEMLLNRETISKEIMDRIKEIKNDEIRIINLFRKII